MTTTDKQQVILDALIAFNEEGTHPTVRALADKLESDESRSERFSDDEVRGLLERLEADGKVKQYAAEGDQRYEPVLETA